MKEKLKLLSILGALWVAQPLRADSTEFSNSNAEANAEATAEANATGNQTSTSKKSVTVTSDGKNTIRRIVTTVNGVEKVVTETTDENGKTTRKEGDGGEDEPVEGEDTPWLGVRVKEVSETLRGQLDLAEDEGLAIELVADEGPAAKAGITAGDLMLSIGGNPVATSEELASELEKRTVGDTVAVSIMRKGKRADILVTLEERPAKKKDEDVPPGLGDGIDKDTDGGGVSVSVDGADVGKAFDTVLDDPKVPESFKESVREMQKMLRDFEKKHMRK